MTGPGLLCAALIASAAPSTAATTATSTATTTAASATTPTSTATTNPSCQGQLDSSPQCVSPAREPVTITADAKTSTTAATPPPLRDPAIFPGELGFVSAVVAVASGAAIAVSFTTDPAHLDDAGRALADNARIGGVVGLSLAGLVGSAAIATFVFDPATGTLRLPIFDGESR